MTDVSFRGLAHRSGPGTLLPPLHVLLWLYVLGFTVAAVSFWQVRKYEHFLPGVWPLWFGVAAVACVVFALHPSERLHRWSGAVSVVAVLSRTGGVALNLLDGHVYRSPWYGYVGLVVWPLFSAATLFVWSVGFRAFTPSVDDDGSLTDPAG